MSIFKRFKGIAGPTKKEKALAFKNKLKYGDDIERMYKDAQQLLADGCAAEKIVREKLEDIMNYTERDIYHNWTSFRISTYSDCAESPIKKCLYISYYGDNSPEKDDPIYCLCCKEKIF